MQESASTWGRWRTPVLAAGVVGCYALSRFAGVGLYQLAGNMPVIWCAGAFLTAAMLMMSRRWAIACAATCAIISFGISQFLGLSVTLSAAFTLQSVAGAALVAHLARRFVRETRLTTPQRVGKLLAFAILPGSLVAATTSAILTSAAAQQSYATTFLQWFSADFLGMSLVLPGLLILGAPGAAKESRRPWWEIALVQGAVAVANLAPLLLLRLPAILLIFPIMVTIAFRYGPKVTAVAGFITAAVNIPVIIWGVGQLREEGLGFAGVFILQQFVLGVFYTGLVTAMAVAYQARTKRLLVERTESSRAARARALQASKAKTDFLATMSHEVRTPMNSIVGFTQVLLRRTDIAPEARRQLNLIDRAGAALVTVVDDILDFAKVEAGEIALSPRPVQLRAIAQDCAAIVAESARRKGLTLEVEADDGCEAYHLADDQRVRQVLLNLLNNAVKFTEAGGVRLEVTCAERVRFRIIDTGVGIAPEHFDRLFKRFSQVEGEISRTYGGTGLGLAICKSLVELMGGTIGVESRQGEGSTFWFELPLPLAATTPEEDHAEGEAQGLTAHVLLVDDHPMNRELGVAVLTLLGCTVDTAADGEQAIEAMKVSRFDAILMDIHMPKVDGLAAAAAIRQLGGDAAATPIIAMSADVLPEQVARCRKAGMVDAVSKPIKVEALHAALQRWVGRTCEGEDRAAPDLGRARLRA